LPTSPKLDDTAARERDFAHQRALMVERHVAARGIKDQRVLQAMREVPRHLFVPEGTPLEVAYHADDSVATKREQDGVIISSISAPFIQAQMIEQAGLGPGMSVLEIGSGGYNAALLAEVVGPGGRVVSVDIDPDVTDRASALLDATGYSSRVAVVQADADHIVLDIEPVDNRATETGAASRAASAPAGGTRQDREPSIATPQRAPTAGTWAHSGRLRRTSSRA